jgi:hypothetical protein
MGKTSPKKDPKKPVNKGVNAINRVFFIKVENRPQKSQGKAFGFLPVFSRFLPCFKSMIYSLKRL